MKTEKEVRKMLKHAIDTDGLVSPSAIAALEWILEQDNEFDVFNEKN